MALLLAAPLLRVFQPFHLVGCLFNAGFYDHNRHLAKSHDASESGEWAQVSGLR